MRKRSFLKSTAAAVMVAGLFAASAAQADNLVIEQDINAPGFSVSVNGVADTVTAGLFNVSNLDTGKSFLAFCFELIQGVSVNTMTAPGLPFAKDVAGASTQLLFNQSFAGLNLGDASQVAGFQIALWELADDKNLSSGNYQGWVGIPRTSGGAALGYAQQFLNNVVSNSPTTGQYDLTVWTNASSQDIIQAEPGSGNKVPEPATSLLAALGLAGLALARRRRG